MNKREEILKKANEIVNGQREEAYGSPEDNFGLIANFWSFYLQTNVTSIDVAMMMILLKIARASNGVPHEDNYTDIAGYAACAAEISDKIWRCNE